MKDSHIYQRMSNPNVFKTYLNMINNNDLENVKFLVGNITMAANDHPRYSTIIDAYNNRLNRESNKE